MKSSSRLPQEARQDCPGAESIPPGDLAAATKAYAARLAARLAPSKRVAPAYGSLLTSESGAVDPNMYKIALLSLDQYALIFFADLDVNLSPDGPDRSRPPALLEPSAWMRTARDPLWPSRAEPNRRRVFTACGGV